MASTAAMACPKIMRRPAPSAVVCKPTAVAVGGTSDGTLRGGANSSSGGEGNAAIRKNETDPLEPSLSLALDKEEKKDDQVVMIRKPESQAGVVVGRNCDSPGSPTNYCGTEASGNDIMAPATSSKTPWNPLDEVDSALLSALCDSRERKALFRLEQVLLDFIKDESCGSVEVGGSYNSILLHQKKDGSGGDAEGDGHALPTISQQGQQELQYQQQRGLRQTSFQRLILHRLADRFNIIREQINYANSYGNERGLADVGGNNMGGGQHNFSLGLIRLVKTEESIAPSNLLIDIDLSILINYKNPRARNYGQGSNVIASPNNSHHYDDGVRNITENMASATLNTASVAAGPTGGNSGSKKSKKKMVIMKRNSTSGSGDLDGSGKGKQKGKVRRKKLEDREKAYEEARARIFGLSESSGGNSEGSGGDDDAEKGDARPPVPQSQDLQDMTPTPLNSSSCHSSFSVENIDATSSTNAAAAGAHAGAGVGEHIVPSQLISSATSTDQARPPSPEQPRDQEPVPVSGGADPDQARQESTSSVPAAVTGGAISKAVYRNRQQEENDPDFKRRSDVRPTYVPSYAANPFVPQVGANPYGAMAQQPPPPQIIAMQMQQQAMQQQALQQQALQQQAQLFHGQSNQFPTPQDAASYANSHPPQWVSPPRGFYPPPQPQPPQQQQHPQQQAQDQRTQVWQQPRPQMPPPSNNVALSNDGNYPAQVNNPTPTIVDSPQPQPKQPAKVLWGPGLRGDSNNSSAARSSQASSEGGQTTKKEKGTAMYKPEDFPALG